MKKLQSLLLLGVLVFAACVSSAADPRKTLVMLIAEHEYETATTLPEFAAKQLARDFRVVTVTGSLAPGHTAFDSVKEIANADVLLVSVRRRPPPKDQLEVIRRHIRAGKPVVGIRTASHAFSVVRNQKLAEGNEEWTQFDAEVIGGNYVGHHGKGPAVQVTLADGADAKHPILKGVKLPFQSDYSLYKNTPLRPGAKALLTGTIPGQSPEPVAWVFTRADGGRTFYTSLGGVSDFKNASFVTLLRNGILWAAAKLPPVPSLVGAASRRDACSSTRIGRGLKPLLHLTGHPSSFPPIRLRHASTGRSSAAFMAALISSSVNGFMIAACAPSPFASFR